MKNLLFALITFTLISCGGPGSSNNTVSVNPPSWIIGTWIFEYSFPPVETGFKFTSSTFIQIPTSGNEIDWGQNVMDYGADASLTDDLNGDTYNVYIQLSGATTTYSFKKIDNTKIEWLQAGSSGYYIKQ